MTSDSHLFRTRAELEAKGFRLEGNVFVKEPAESGEQQTASGMASSERRVASGMASSEWRVASSEEEQQLATRYLPLYEAKMIHQFDHRFATYREERRAGGEWRVETADVGDTEKADPTYQVLPRYWVPEAEVEARLRAKGWDRGWLLGWRNIARSTDERTVIAAVIPRVGVSGKYPIVLSNRYEQLHLLLSLYCSLMFDFATRQKVGGTDLSFHYMKQLPVLPPWIFDQPLPFAWEFDHSPLATRHSPNPDHSPLAARHSPNPDHSPLATRHSPPTVADFIRPRVLELTYTAWDLKPFADDLWESADEAGRLAMLRQWEENQGASGEWRVASSEEEQPLATRHSLLAESSPLATRHSPLPPFRYDPERRFQIRCELDALFFHLYLPANPDGSWRRATRDWAVVEETPEELAALAALFPTPRDAVAYILDQFPIVRRQDEERYGTYRTKETILALYDAMQRTRS